MNAHARRNSTCPHDCPSVCALSVEITPEGGIGRIHGRSDQSYTAGVICAKVARYSERLTHPERLLHPLKRVGGKGEGRFERVSWDEALDDIARHFLRIAQEYGAEAIWPYYYAGTMGHVQRDGINRLRHAMGYSGFYSTICVNTAWPAFMAGTGKLAGPDPREIAKADCVVIWGTNAVATQVNVMTHAIRARKERGAKIVVIDLYLNDTMKQADMALMVRPGSDGALACAVMHVLFRDGLVDRDYLARYADDPEGLEQHLATRTPNWAAPITGLSVEEIEAFARLVGTTKKTFFRLGYGFSRQRNGAVNLHAASCIPTLTGAWQYEGGGAFHNNGGVFGLDKTLIEGSDVRNPRVRMLDQSRLGAILTGEKDALRRPNGSEGPPVKALLIQNTNPLAVCPDQDKVRAGFAREDLFTVVHEQFMTDTAQMADYVLPATMFLEHDDYYQGGGHSHIGLGLKLVEPPGEARENHWVITELAKRLGAKHEGFGLTARQIIDRTLQASGRGTLEQAEELGFIDVMPDFDEAHYIKGFAFPDGKFRLKPDWARCGFANIGFLGPAADLPVFPDHWAVNEAVDEAYPFKLITPPARSFLNTSFTETEGSLRREKAPTLIMHPHDASAHGFSDGQGVRVGSRRGETVLSVKVEALSRPGVLIAEGVWPNRAHTGGKGINTLTSAESTAPFGGVAFHDNAVWVKPI